MANADLYLISITKAGGSEKEFRAILSPREAADLRGMLKLQYEANAILDYMVVQCGIDEAVSYESAMRQLAVK